MPGLVNLVVTSLRDDSILQARRNTSEVSEPSHFGTEHDQIFWLIARSRAYLLCFPITKTGCNPLTCAWVNLNTGAGL